MLALAGILGLLLCSDAHAQRGGGGKRGGGGSRPNAYPGYNSGYNHNYGSYRGGYSNGITFGVGLGYGIQPQYYNRSYYPYSSSYDYPSQGTTYYTTPSVVYSTPNVVYTPSSPIYDITTVSAEVTTGRAIIEVTVPAADAKVLFGTTVMEQQQGKERRYESTEIALGQNFTYTITARWMNDGKPMEQVQKVDVMAGKTSKAIFRNEDATRQMPPPEPSRVK
jgi:uncharacterized protein (TIGR03000 family)